MEKILHTQKVEILSRLIKESSLTLEEALLLLKEEETPVIINTPSYTPPLGSGGYSYTGNGSYPLSGTTFSSGVLTNDGNTSTSTKDNHLTFTLTNL